MSIDITHTIRPQKVQFLKNKDILEHPNYQAFTQKTVERSPQKAVIMWFFYPNKDIYLLSFCSFPNARTLAVVNT